MRRSVYRQVITWCAIAGVVVGISCTNSSRHATEIHRLANSLHEAGEFDGAILVSEGGRVIYRGAFGVARLDDGTRNTVDTVFDLASITKPFTALSVMILSEEGTIDLKAPVQAYLPGIPYSSVTVEHLLTHTSGIPNYAHHPGFLSYADDLAGQVAYSDDLLMWLASSEPALRFAPGDSRQYSNTNYVILGAIVDAVSGTTWEDFLRERIFDHLEMGRTFVWTPLESEPVDRWSHGHQRTLDRRSREPIDSSGHSALLQGIRGANGVFSTVDDLYKLDRALYSEDLVSSTLLSEAFRRFSLNGGEKEPYGYGWIIRSKIDEPKIVWHGGRGGGYLTSFHREIDAGHCVIILSNSSAHHLTIDELGSAILDILHDREYRAPRIPISHPVAAAVFESGFEHAVALYRQLREEAEAEYIFNEHELNLLGYRLMWEGHHEEALAILTLNTEEYPDSANAYDSLGDAYRQVGDIPRAQTSYETALSLQSGFEPSQRKLDELTALQSTRGGS